MSINLAKTAEYGTVLNTSPHDPLAVLLSAR